MTISTSIRTSSPFAHSERSLTASISASPPATTEGSTVDAADLDPGSDLRLALDVEVDLAEALADASALESGLPLGIYLHIWCAATRWSTCTELASLESDDGVIRRFDSLEASIPMADLSRSASGRITVASQPGAAEFPPGAVIAVWPFRIRLERQGREISTDWDSFSQRQWPSDALWNLHIRDWFGYAEESLTLVLNRDAEDFRQAFPIEKATSTEEKLLLGEVTYDALATLLQEYLMDEKLTTAADPSGDKLVDRVERTFQSLFESERKRTKLKSLAQEDPGTFRMYIQEAVRKSILSGVGG